MSGRITGVDVVHKGYVTVLKAIIEQPDGARAQRELTQHGQAVAFLPYDAERRVALLVSMPRAPVLHAGIAEDLLEAPAGMIDDGDSGPEATARREALEEVGLKLGALEPVAHVWPSPGVSTERIHLFLAPYVASDRVAEGGGAPGEHENIRITETPLPVLARMADEGRLTDLKTFALALALRSRRPELF